ncbi:MAG: hypothetical protein U5N85_01840 [Arcicella sp.]|nr:hypothetical protein [Arcicella sp.]
MIYTYRDENQSLRQYWFLAKGQKQRKLILTVNNDTVKVHQTSVLTTITIEYK